MIFPERKRSQQASIPFILQQRVQNYSLAILVSQQRWAVYLLQQFSEKHRITESSKTLAYKSQTASRVWLPNIKLHTSDITIFSKRLLITSATRSWICLLSTDVSSQYLYCFYTVIYILHWEAMSLHFMHRNEINWLQLMFPVTSISLARHHDTWF